MFSSRFNNFGLALVITTSCLACNKETSKSAVSSPHQQSKTITIPSYIVIESKQTGFNNKWAYGLITGSPSDEELRVLAVQLHSRYPETRFNVCNNSSKFRQMDKHMSDPNSPLDEAWVDQHCFEMLNIFMDDGSPKWQAIGSKADGRKDGRIIASLD